MMKNLINETDGHACLICQSGTDYFFSKEYPVFPGSPFSQALKVDYWKCGCCGFVVSRTHQEMTASQWVALNSSWHHFYENNIKEKISNAPPYANQALALMMLSKNGIIDIDDVLDYAAGYGTLANFLSFYFDRKIKIFDRYVRNEKNDSIYIEENEVKKYKLVINSAMFEHVLSRGALDEVNDLVADDGVLMLHTVVCERIPRSPDWFYLNPMVHTAFHTNKSMSILMEQWGYSGSVYSSQAKSWFLFKKECPVLESLGRRIYKINTDIRNEYFHYKPGFVDYWKGFSD